MKYCPICDSELHHEIVAIEGSVVSESKADCKNGCYNEQFAYGLTTIGIFGKKEFHYYYNDSKETKLKTDIKLAEEIAYWLNDFRYLTRLMEEPEMHTINRALGFKVYERLGPVYIDDRAIAKVKIKGED